MPDPQFSFLNELLKEVAKWSVPLVGGLIAVFFTPLVENLKIRLSRADLRLRQYEELARDLSSFVFEAELQHEFLSSSWATAANLKAITESYNVAIVNVRGKELVYLSWAKKYWQPDEYKKFEAVLAQVRVVDANVHAFNDNKSTPEKLAALSHSTGILRDQVSQLLRPQ